MEYMKLGDLLSYLIKHYRLVTFPTIACKYTALYCLFTYSSGQCMVFSPISPCN